MPQTGKETMSKINYYWESVRVEHRTENGSPKLPSFIESEILAELGKLSNSREFRDNLATIQIVSIKDATLIMYPKYNAE